MRGLGILLSVAVAAVVLWQTVATPSLAGACGGVSGCTAISTKVERSPADRPGLKITLYDPATETDPIAPTRFGAAGQ